VTYRNRAEADAKHVFQMVCDMVDISEAKAQNRWSAQYPPVKIEWLAASKPHGLPSVHLCGKLPLPVLRPEHCALAGLAVADAGPVGKQGGAGIPKVYGSSYGTARLNFSFSLQEHFGA
jgi:hypothetical protein